MTNNLIYINAIGIVNSLGNDNQIILKRLLQGDLSSMSQYTSSQYSHSFLTGMVKSDLPAIPDHLTQFSCRNNQLLLSAVSKIMNDIQYFINTYGRDRVGIVLGSTTSGISEAGFAFTQWLNGKQFDDSYDYRIQETGTCSLFLAEYLNIDGPAYTLSTACSSSAKVVASARGLIELGLCDCVIAGGVDSLSELTLNGFDSLEAISETHCNPFSRNRDGINIGEGATVLIISKEKSAIELAGIGESSDAYHMSAPKDDGGGAIQAMTYALMDADINANNVDYVNLHGTATHLNDTAESLAMHAIFPEKVPCSSTKPVIGHLLGAAGATEIAFCALLLLNQNDVQQLPPHCYDGEYDAMLPKLDLVKLDNKYDRCHLMMTNSFAFGGNNVSVILRRVSFD